MVERYLTSPATCWFQRVHHQGVRSIGFPDGYGRDQLRCLDFLDSGGDLVFYGDVGTGKTHLACALVAQACQAGIALGFRNLDHYILRSLIHSGQLQARINAL